MAYCKVTFCTSDFAFRAQRSSNQNHKQKQGNIFSFPFFAPSTPTAATLPPPPPPPAAPPRPPPAAAAQAAAAVAAAAAAWAAAAAAATGPPRPRTRKSAWNISSRKSRTTSVWGREISFLGKSFFCVEETCVDINVGVLDCCVYCCC